MSAFRDTKPSGEKNKSIWCFLKALGSRKLNQILNKKGCHAGGDIIILVIFSPEIKKVVFLS